MNKTSSEFSIRAKGSLNQGRERWFVHLLLDVPVFFISSAKTTKLRKWTWDHEMLNYILIGFQERESNVLIPHVLVSSDSQMTFGNLSLHPPFLKSPRVVRLLTSCDGVLWHDIRMSLFEGGYVWRQERERDMIWKVVWLWILFFRHHFMRIRIFMNCEKRMRLMFEWLNCVTSVVAILIYLNEG